MTLIWSLQRLPGAVCEERISNGASKNSVKPFTISHLRHLHVVPTLVKSNFVAVVLSELQLTAGIIIPNGDHK